jgi:hypothetical protein
VVALAAALVVGCQPKPAAALDQGGRERLLDLALEFAQCAGLRHALSDLGPELGATPDETRLNRELALGSAVTAEYLMVGTARDVDDWRARTGGRKAFIRDQIESRRGHWRARLDGRLTSMALEQERRCLELSPIQVEVVDTLRKRVWTQP